MLGKYDEKNSKNTEIIIYVQYSKDKILFVIFLFVNQKEITKKGQNFYWTYNIIIQYKSSFYIIFNFQKLLTLFELLIKLY